MELNCCELTLELPYGCLAAKAWGDKHSPPVMGLHGWLDNAGSFDLIAPYLGDVYFVALDLPGHGQSAHRPKGSHYPFIEGVSDIFFAADALGWETFSIMGHSMGAGLASIAAGAWPERIDKIVFLEGLGPLSTEAEEAPAQFKKALLSMRKHQKRPPKTYPTLTSAIMQRQKGYPVAWEGAKSLVERGTHLKNETYSFSFDPRLRWPSMIRLTEDQVRAFLSKIECPALLIQAEEGILTEFEAMPGRLAQVPHLEVIHIKGRHHVHLDAPKECAHSVIPFLCRTK